MADTEFEQKIKSGDFSWWFVYGPGRSGTTYIATAIKRSARRIISDAGLGFVVNQRTKVQRLDQDRFLSDLAANMFDTAQLSGGTQIDLVFKQANTSVEEYESLVSMFGEPARRIFCLREPSGYIASARKKFGDDTLDHRQFSYVKSLGIYDTIGGDIIEYGENLTTAKIATFLEPLDLGDSASEFAFAGKTEPENVTPRMKKAYNDFKRSHGATIFS